MTPVELDPNIVLKNYRFIGAELEALGHRIDAVRERIAESTSKWAQWYWQETLDRLMLQWRTKISLYDGHAKDTSSANWKIDYDWFETFRYEPGYSIVDRWHDELFRTAPLSHSFHQAREARLRRGQ